MSVRWTAALLIATTSGCIGWNEPTLERTRQAASAPLSEIAARNRAAVLELNGVRAMPPTEMQDAIPELPPPGQKAPRRSGDAVPPAIPTPSSSRATDPSGVTLPFTPSPYPRETGQLRFVPPYSVQMPAGSVYPNTLRCVPDLSGGSVCR